MQVCITTRLRKALILNKAVYGSLLTDPAFWKVVAKNAISDAPSLPTLSKNSGDSSPCITCSNGPWHIINTVIRIRVIMSLQPLHDQRLLSGQASPHKADKL